MKNLMIFLIQDPANGNGEETQSLVDLILLGGPLGIAIVAILLVLSVIAAYIFVERYFTIQRAGKVDESFIDNIRVRVQSGNIKEAKLLCQTNDSPASRMIEKGLMRIGKPMRDINAAVENVGNLEVFKLEKNLSTLASIAGAAPMIGFFGTVTGMIIAFYRMATEQNVTPDVLAGGIYQALITTAVGLFIGILAFIGYNILVANVEKVVFKMERTSMEFLDLLQEPTE
ncbi:MAG: MotA/TolQ/ExbB proton channel family protein [Saprospirales bacterium]|nr:MAG: MotA/TolQ/ExbB proton channel family protein [Saprospirales bacterium]